MNLVKTFLLLTVLTLLFITIGGAIAGRQGMLFAFFLACLMNLGSYWFSDRIVLAMYRAQPIAEQGAPQIFKIVRALCQKMEVPMPRIYVIPTEAPNAFATGRDPRHAAVAVTQGITRLLTEEELSGVIAHELAHVKHRDILISSIAATLAGAITMLANMARWALVFGSHRSREERSGNPLALLLTLILAPIAALLVQLAISRAREFAADEGGARVEGNPLHLASALRKLEEAKGRYLFPAHPTTAHLFIVNPLAGDFWMRLFSTHPPIEERIRRLEDQTKFRS